MRKCKTEMDYVSFETAKLLKEKGFDESCYQKYDCDGDLSFNYVGYINGEKPCDDFCALAPTHQMAMKWLKDNHDIDIDTDTVWGMDGVITYYVKGYRFRLHSPIFPNYDVNEIFLTREIAYDEAIKKCLTDLI